MAERLFYIRGDIDIASGPAFEAAIRDAVANSSDDLVVDCCDLTFIDSRGISVLIDTQRKLQAEGHSLRVVNPNPIATRVLDLMGLSEFLRVEDGRTIAPTA